MALGNQRQFLLAASVGLSTVAGCSPTIQNEANPIGPPPDPSTVPKERSPREAVEGAQAGDPRNPAEDAKKKVVGGPHRSGSKLTGPMQDNRSRGLGRGPWPRHPAIWGIPERCFFPIRSCFQPAACAMATAEPLRALWGLLPHHVPSKSRTFTRVEGSITMTESKRSCFYSDRATRRYRDHRCLDRAVTTRRPVGPRGSAADPMHQQLEAARPVLAQLHLLERLAAAVGSLLLPRLLAHKRVAGHLRRPVDEVPPAQLHGAGVAHERDEFLLPGGLLGRPRHLQLDHQRHHGRRLPLSVRPEPGLPG